MLSQEHEVTFMPVWCLLSSKSLPLSCKSQGVAPGTGVPCRCDPKVGSPAQENDEGNKMPTLCAGCRRKAGPVHGLVDACADQYPGK